MSGSPQTCGRSEGTCVLPAAMSASASRRGAARLVGFALPYSRLRLANPVAPSGRPMFPANWAASPSPARVHPGVELDAAAGAGVLELEVHHAGDGVRAVLRRRAVAQHLDLPQRNRGYGRDVGRLRAERYAVTTVPVDYRRAVTALAVDEDQRMVRRQVAQHGGADHGRAAADRLRVGVERGYERAEVVLQVARPLTDEVCGRQHVYRDCGLGGAARLRAGADDHRLLREAGEQAPHLRG